MAWLKTSLAAAVLAAFAACGGGTDTRAAKGTPCAQCKYGVSDQKASPPTVYCKVDGKKVDCRKNPSECPEWRQGDDEVDPPEGGGRPTVSLKPGQGAGTRRKEMPPADS